MKQPIGTVEDKVLSTTSTLNGPKIYDSQTRLPSTLVGTALDEALKNGTNSFQIADADARVGMLSPEGKPWEFPAKSAAWALQHGYTLESEEAADRRRYLKENQGVIGDLKVGAGEAANELLFGVPETLYDNMASKKDVALKDALKEAHPISNVVGHGIGIAGSLVTGGELFKTGELIGQSAKGFIIGERALEGTEALAAGTRALEKVGLTATATNLAPKVLPEAVQSLTGTGLKEIASEGATQAIPSLGSKLANVEYRGRQLVGEVVKQAVKGAVLTAPNAAAEAFTGDPETAAEQLLWGGIMGGAIGEVGVSYSEAARKLIGGAGNVLQMAIENPDVVSSVAGKVVKGATIGASALLGLKGLVGHSAIESIYALNSLSLGKTATEFVEETTANWLKNGAKVARKALLDASKTPWESGLGTGLAIQSQSVLGQNLAKLPAIVGELMGRDKNPLKEERLGKTEPVSAGVDVGKYHEVSQHIANLANDPSKLLEISSNIASILGHDKKTDALGVAFQKGFINTISFLNANIPKASSASSPMIPFQGKEKAEPSHQQKQAFMHKVEIAGNPLSVIDKFADGSLGANHMLALKSIYPKTFESIQKALLETSTLSDSKLSYSSRVRLGRLMGIPLDDSLQPSRIQKLQMASSVQSSQEENKPSQIKNLPTSSTFIQRVSFGGGKQ